MNCELCQSSGPLSAFSVHAKASEVQLCQACLRGARDGDLSEAAHWRCLSEAIWHEKSEVKALAYRLLTKLQRQDLLADAYFSDDEMQWAAVEDEHRDEIVVKDSNGTRLLAGDSVTLIKDLEVKGGGFTAKRGTLVKNIALTHNPKHIEGRVNGIQIVLVAEYLKKA